jgi:hypothetical protein
MKRGLRVFEKNFRMRNKARENWKNFILRDEALGSLIKS